jgi:hypothetical protein
MAGPRRRQWLVAEGVVPENDTRACRERASFTVDAVEKHATGVFSKLELTATPTDHRRVLAVRAFLSAR